LERLAEESAEVTVERLERECAGGEAERCASLGMLSRVGRGVPQDERRAAALP
jgi:hypothetical protein